MKHFQDFYTKLYNLPPHHKWEGLGRDRSQIIRDYLNKSGMPVLSDSDISLLEEPITASEVGLTLLGKSPGPDGHTSIYYKTLSNFSRPTQKGIGLYV